jgi:hypothetical protein
MTFQQLQPLAFRSEHLYTVIHGQLLSYRFLRH